MSRILFINSFDKYLLLTRCLALLHGAYREDGLTINQSKLASDSEKCYQEKWSKGV